MQSEKIDIAARLRADIEARDWRRMHLESDKRRPVRLPDRNRARADTFNDERRIIQIGRVVEPFAGH